MRDKGDRSFTPIQVQKRTGSLPYSLVYMVKIQPPKLVNSLTYMTLNDIMTSILWAADNMIESKHC